MEDKNTKLSTDTITNTIDGLNNLTSKYIVSPIFGLGLAGFVFDIEDSTKMDLRADITDHYMEDNSTTQDHIAIRPIKITLRRFVGELKNIVKDEKETVQKLAEKLVKITSMIPVLTNQAKQVRDVIQEDKETISDYIDATVGTGIDLYQSFKELNPPDTEQARAFNFLRSLFESKQLVSLETPYGFFPDMAIESLVATQNGDSNQISDFSITLKEFKTVKTKLVPFDPEKYQGRGEGQRSELSDKGKAQGEDKPLQSLFFKASKLLGGSQ
jgi:hypothetical protein